MVWSIQGAGWGCSMVVSCPASFSASVKRGWARDYPIPWFLYASVMSLRHSTATVCIRTSRWSLHFQVKRNAILNMAKVVNTVRMHTWIVSCTRPLPPQLWMWCNTPRAGESLEWSESVHALISRYCTLYSCSQDMTFNYNQGQCLIMQLLYIIHLCMCIKAHTGAIW